MLPRRVRTRPSNMDTISPFGNAEFGTDGSQSSGFGATWNVRIV